MKKIIIVEDEKNIANGLKFNLESEGYSVKIFSTAEDAMGSYASFDLMILDIMLPGINGFDFLAHIRSIDPKYPVLILSAKTEEENILKGLSGGADDYISKPFSLQELLLRIKRILKRQEWYTNVLKKEESITFGDFYINFDTQEAKTVQGSVVLTQYECYVMKYLIENKNRNVTREELLEKVWGYSNTMETRTVDAFISRLRKYFESNLKEPRHIKSIRSVGYRFSA